MEYKVQEYDNARLPAEKRKDITGECQKFIENVTDSMNKIMDSYAKAKEKSTKALQAQVMIGNEIKGFSSFSEAWAVGYNSGKDFTVRACQDISADTARGFNLSQLSEKFGFNSTKGFLVPEGREVAVELNGHTIDCSSLRGITLFDVQKGAVFTLQNGQVNGAAAAVRYSSHDKAETSLYMENVKIDRCSGTAVYFDGSNPSDKLMMHNCEINGAQNGAVVMEWRLKYMISDTTFSNNHAEYGAAVDALYAEDGSYVRNCRFTENTADKAAGALYCVSGVSRCVFENNKAGTDGGALFIRSNEDGAVSRCTFEGNTAGADGGAICAGCHAKLMADNTTIINNRAGGKGGGIYLGALTVSNHRLTNVTVTGNSAGHGGGIYCSAGAFKAADTYLCGTVIIRDNSGDNAYLVSDSGKKALLYTREDFDRSGSAVYVSSSSRSDIAVVDLDSKSHQDAFRADYGRRIYRGTMYNGTLYLDDM